MLVVDASALVHGLIGTDPAGTAVLERLSQAHAVAPELVYLEVTSALRRLSTAGTVTPRRSREALEDLSALHLEAAGHRELLARVWQLRGSLTAYDASYVVLAEALDCPLLTADARLARAAARHCTVELVA